LSSFYLEHCLWGFNPTGYHAVNVVLHALNALLVWLILRRLNVTGSNPAARGSSGSGARHSIR
jgi:hypothetical protein